MAPIFSTFSLGSRPRAEKDDLVYYAHSTSIDSATVAYPAGIQADDIAIMCQTSYTNSGLTPAAPTDVIPSGYTSAGSGTVNGGLFNYGGWRLSYVYKRLTGGESGSITGMDSTHDRKILVILRPSGAYKNYTITNGSADSVGQFSQGDPPSQALNWSGKNKPFIFLFGWTSTGAFYGNYTNNYSYDEYATTDDQHKFGISLQLGSGTLPSNETADMGDTGDNLHFHSYLQLS